MKKNNSAKRGLQDANQPPAQPEKVGWVRKFCGKGIFREIWKNRYVVLKGEQLYISEKESELQGCIREIWKNRYVVLKEEQLYISEKESELQGCIPNARVLKGERLYISEKESELQGCIPNARVLKGERLYISEKESELQGCIREIWKNRYVVLKGEQLYISEKEVKDEKNTQEVFDLNDYEKCEELRKSKSRSKKNYSKFLLSHSKEPGNTAPNLVFLAVSPEEKESWINALNSAITRAKNRILDEVTVEEESYLAHPTRDRAKIQHSRRPPTRGHLMAVASTSTSDGMLTLDLIQEEDAAPEDRHTCEETFRVDLDKSVAQLTAGRRRSDSENVKPPEKSRTNSLPRREVAPSWDKFSHRKDSFDKGTMYTPQVPKRLTLSEKNKCASMEEILSCRDSSSAHRAVLRRGLEDQFASVEPERLTRIQELVALKLEKTQELLAEVRGYGEGKRTEPPVTASPTSAASSPASSSKLDSGAMLQESERLLGEASSHWSQAQQVLQEVTELRNLYKQLELQLSDPKSTQSQYRKSLM